MRRSSHKALEIYRQESKQWLTHIAAVEKRYGIKKKDKLKMSPLAKEQLTTYYLT